MIKSSVSATTVAPTGSTSTPQTKSRKKAYTWLTIIGVVVLFWAWPRPKPQANRPAIKVNWDRQPCENLLDPNYVDKTTDGSTPVIKFTMKEGCYAGEYKLPTVNWSGSEEFKSRKEGDWASVWCEGRQNPSRIYWWYEDFSSEFQGCRVFSLQGKGWIAFKRNY